MKANDMVSCIVPVYNGQQYLQKCVNSLLEQIYSNIEIIIVDDGSIDNSLELADALANASDKIKVYHQPNRGVSAARNLGIENCSGKYLMFVDVDDSLPPDAIKILIEQIQNDDYDIVMGRDLCFKNNGTPVSQSFSGKLELWEGNTALHKAMTDFPNTWNVVGKLFKRAFVADIRFEEGHVIGEDSFFFFECCLRYPRICYYDYCVYWVRLSEHSATRSSFGEKKVQDIIYFINRKIELIKKYNLNYMNEIYNTAIKAYMVILRGLIKCKDKSLSCYENFCCQEIRNKKHCYINGSPYHNIMFWFIKHRLYWLFKLFVRVKNMSKKDENR